MAGLGSLLVWVALKSVALWAEGAIVFGVANGVISRVACLAVCLSVAALFLLVRKCPPWRLVLGSIGMVLLWVGAVAVRAPGALRVSTTRILIGAITTPLFLVLLLAGSAAAHAAWTRIRKNPAKEETAPDPGELSP